MKRLYPVICLIIFALTLSGCVGDPKFDTSSEDKITRSFQKMGSKLLEKDYESLRYILTDLYENPNYKRILAEDNTTVNEALDGKTAKEIFKIYGELTARIEEKIREEEAILGKP